MLYRSMKKNVAFYFFTTLCPQKNVYPNPATNSIQLTDHIVDNTDADKIISLYDLGNNLILRIQSPNSHTSINTGNLKRGNYYLEVKTGKDKQVKQVILK